MIVGPVEGGTDADQGKGKKSAALKRRKVSSIARDINARRKQLLVVGVR